MTYLPLLHHGAEFVGGEVHAMEVGEDVLALYLLSDQAELPGGDLIVLEISQGDLEHTALKSVGSNF